MEEEEEEKEGEDSSGDVSDMEGEEKEEERANAAEDVNGFDPTLTTQISVFALRFVERIKKEVLYEYIHVCVCLCVFEVIVNHTHAHPTRTHTSYISIIICFAGKHRPVHSWRRVDVSSGLFPSDGQHISSLCAWQCSSWAAGVWKCCDSGREFDIHVLLFAAR